MENATLFLGTLKKSDLSATASLQTCKMGKKRDKDRHQDPLQVSLLLGSKRGGREGREGDLVVAWKVGLHWVLNWKSDRKRKAPGS